ncbi:response regulator [uncultured Chitinophaga sp.]|jgi:Response regulator containing CheY-like receiver, AAA-type ATPase, and DNA-binding domains|uniref:response regulator n=1 Tax=uncultured Chitinophaga sp. TaxID=339340 RepID=UPI002603C406|nr:response regulator [uncultured Chitinophaga sp.]
MKSGPIIVVEDDIDDKEIFEAALEELQFPNRIIWFSNCNDAWHYLKVTTDSPFIIFSDINLPRQSGLDFKKQIDEDRQLRKKSIPFIFYSTSVNQDTVNDAYTNMTVQGFFQKSNRFNEMKEMIKVILDYWRICRHPNVG